MRADHGVGGLPVYPNGMVVNRYNDQQQPAKAEKETMP
jgi:hypothetical protein